MLNRKCVRIANIEEINFYLTPLFIRKKKRDWQVYIWPRISFWICGKTKESTVLLESEKKMYRRPDLNLREDCTLC